MDKKKDITEKLKGLTKEQRQEFFDALAALDVDKVKAVDTDMLDAITALQADVSGLKKLLNPAPETPADMPEEKKKSGIIDWFDKILS